MNVIYKIRIYLNLALPITWNEEKPRSTLVQLSVFFVKIWSYAKRHIWFQLQFIVAEAAFPLHAVVARVIIDPNLVCILEHAHNRFFFSCFFLCYHNLQPKFPKSASSFYIRGRMAGVFKIIFGGQLDHISLDRRNTVGFFEILILVVWKGAVDC